MTMKVPVGFALFLAAGVAHALDPQRAPSQYVLAKWDSSSGLPSSGINAMCQTRDHYLWLGTSVGLARFDGARFVVFNARNTPDFGDGVVSSLSAGADGTLSVGASSAVMRYRDGVFARLPIPTGTGVVLSLLSAQDGSLWVSMLGLPVHVWQDGRATNLLDRLRAMGPQTMIQDGRGAIWIGTRRDGLVRFEAGEFRSFPILADTIQAICFDQTGALWIGTLHGLYRWQGGRLERFTRRDGLSQDNISALLEDRDRNLWVGTAGGGLNRFRDGRWSRLDARLGLTDDHVRCLMEDHEGSLWVGTAGGLNRLSDGRFITYGRIEGLPDDATASVTGGADGSVWIGAASGSVTQLRDSSLKRFALPSGTGNDKILVLHQSRDGSLWIGADNGRLFRIQNGGLTEHTPAGAPAGTKVSAVIEDEQGPLFFHTGFGLVRIRGRRAVVVNADVRRLTYVHALLRDRHGTLWLCSSRGLARLNGSDLRIYTARDGLPHHRVRSAVEEADGSLWLATIGGLAYFKDGTFHSVTTAEGLPENHLRLVLDDGRGYLWLASAGQVFRLEKRAVFELFAGKRTQVMPLVFDTYDGLRATENLLSSSPGFRDRQGRLWLATAKGVSVADPARLATAAPAPRVLFERLTVDRQVAASAAEWRSPEYKPGRGEVTVEYTALSYRAPGRIRFRHRLDGLDRDWIEAGAKRSAYYSTLPPGRYRFEVTASDSDGVFNGPTETLSFTLRAPFYRTPLFFAACAAVLAGLAWSAHRLRLGQLHARFTAILEERTRIARELHDTLAQGLAGMGLQIEAAEASLPGTADASRASRHLQLAKAMVRSSLSEVRRSIWVLRAQTSLGTHDVQAALAGSLHQLTAEQGVALKLEVEGQPRALTAEVERALLRIAHEAVTNAVRHAQAGTITVALAFEAEAVQLKVRDDGRGFDPAVLAAEPRGEHFGLQGMAERARGLNGVLQVESRPGGGTEVLCRLPYSP